MDGSQNFYRLIYVIQLVIVFQRSLIRTRLAIGIARTCIPGTGYNCLVVFDGLIFNYDPVSKTSAGCFHKTDALGLFGP